MYTYIPACTCLYTYVSCRFYLFRLVMHISISMVVYVCYAQTSAYMYICISTNMCENTHIYICIIYFRHTRNCVYRHLIYICIYTCMYAIAIHSQVSWHSACSCTARTVTSLVLRLCPPAFGHLTQLERRLNGLTRTEDHKGFSKQILMPIIFESFLQLLPCGTPINEEAPVFKRSYRIIPCYAPGVG